MPVDIASGAVTLAFDDVAIQGKVTLVWDRRYSTTLLDRVDRPFGQGWTNRYFATLTRRAEAFDFLTAEGVVEVIQDADQQVERGGKAVNLGAFLEVFKDDRRYIVQHWDVAEGQVWRYCFDTALLGVPSRLGSIEDVTGQPLQLRWNQRGLLVGVRQRAEGRDLQVTYTPSDLINGVIVQMANGERHVLARYEYDAARRLRAAYDAAGSADRYEYDERGQLVREVVKDGGVFSYRYDSNGRCIRTSGLDRYDEKRLRFLEASRITQVADSDGNSYWYQYLPSGQITREIDPLGSERTTAYDELGRVVEQTDAKGGLTRWIYDENGNRAGLVDALDNTYSFEYAPHHLLIAMTDPMGQVWRRAYDNRNRVIETVDPLGSRWLFSYDAEGNVATVTNPMGARKHQRQVRGLLAEVTDWAGNSTRVGFDAFGRVIEIVGPLGDVTRLRYDLLGNNVELTLPDGSVQHATYDSVGNLTNFTDATGNTTRYRYGPCGRLLESVDPLGTVVRYVWGTEPGRLEQVVNGRGEAHSFVRDPCGRIIEERQFDGAIRQFEYDVDGFVIAYTNANEARVTLERDALHRVIAASTPDAGQVTYRFDALGRLIAASNASAHISLERDALGRIVRETQDDHWVASSYDALGNILRTVTSLGHAVDYEVDANGCVSGLTTLTNYRCEFQRGPHRQVTRQWMPGGVLMEQRYDLRGRRTDQFVRVGPEAAGGQSSLPRNDIIARQYSYDARALVTSVHDSLRARVDYSYDPAERLLEARRERGASESFSYDAAGNISRIQIQDTTVVDERLVHGAGNRLLQKGTTRYEYDQEGRRVAKIEAAESGAPQMWRYQWDSLDHLTAVTRPDGDVWHYAYDALGRRVEKMGPGGRRRFVWDREVVVHETDEAEESAAWVFDIDSWKPVATVQEGQVYSVIDDQLGTPRELVDRRGSVVLSLDTHAWGASLAPGDAELRAPHCPIRFQGQWRDAESGLHYNRFRYYDPEVGSFLSQDPVRLKGGLNFYSYAPNPTSWLDPWGLVAAPASLPDTPGIYIITNGTTSYVGSAGLGDAGMNTRVSSASHESAQSLLSKPGTTVQYIEVDLGTATSRSDKNNILRYYEQREYQKQLDKGFDMLNDPSTPPQAAAKKEAAEKLIKDKKASASSRRKTCTS